MKKQVCLYSVLFVILVGVISCSKDSDNNDDKYKEFTFLFKKTDYFIDNLTYYGSGGSDSGESSDGKYIVTILGRVIIVKKKYSTGPTYYEIKDALKNHYKVNKKVNDVFINRSGTVSIDCRN